MSNNPVAALNGVRRVLKFRLARDLHMTVAQLEATMSVHEFNEWVAFNRWEHKRSLLKESQSPS